MIEKLKKYFKGIGEVKGFIFYQIEESENVYIYRVFNGDKSYLEVFKKKTSPKLLDFENRIYSDTEFKEIYPKSKAFGIWAWTFEKLEKAKEKLSNL